MKKLGICGWSPEQDKMLRDLKQRGFTAAKIADEMGRTVGAISTRSSILGIKRGDLTREEIREIRVISADAAADKKAEKIIALWRKEHGLIKSYINTGRMPPELTWLSTRSPNEFASW